MATRKRIEEPPTKERLIEAHITRTLELASRVTKARAEYERVQKELFGDPDGDGQGKEYEVENLAILIAKAKESLEYLQRQYDAARVEKENMSSLLHTLEEGIAKAKAEYAEALADGADYYRMDQ